MTELTALRKLARLIRAEVKHLDRGTVAEKAKRRGTVTNLQIRNCRMRDVLDALAAVDEEAGR